MSALTSARFQRKLWLAAALLLAIVAYWPGLSGGFFFDDYPSIVENSDVHMEHLSVAGLTTAALSSTTSDFKRPLASLTFALNYRTTGLDPFWMKLTNLLLHLINGILVFLLARALLAASTINNAPGPDIARPAERAYAPYLPIIIAAGWMLLPINLTGVLYIVQRMESLANIFVLIGLLGYVIGRQRMLRQPEEPGFTSATGRPFLLCVTSITLPTAVGLLAKETAVMLPLYACLIEWALFRAQRINRLTNATPPTGPELAFQSDKRIWVLFGIVLILPLIVGSSWILPRVLDAQIWAARDFTLQTRLLSEARIVLDYIQWTLLPTQHSLKFYYDDFAVSGGWLTPWTTLASILAIALIFVLIVAVRRRLPLVALGLALFFGAHLLTGTILPLELVYEHRNYFASFGLLLALIPLLWNADFTRTKTQSHILADVSSEPAASTRASATSRLLPRVVLAGLFTLWTVQTALAAYTWGSPLRLTQELAARSPNSLRAQYDLGRSYSILTKYDPQSRFVPLAYESLEKAASLPNSSILPEQALIYMNALMHLPAKNEWWDSMLAKLAKHSPSAQDQGALRALSICAIKQRCDLPKDRMVQAFGTALTHPEPGAQLQARYGDYAWNVLGDKPLGERMMAGAVETDSKEPDYRIAWIHMLVAQGKLDQARAALLPLESLNVGGRLDNAIDELRKLCAMPSK